MAVKATLLPAILFTVACAPKVPAEPPPSPEAKPAAPLAATSAEATELERPPDGGVDASRRKSTGIESCDEYLALYQACEPKLQAEIQGGDRRSYESERAWIEYMRDTPEGAQLGEACWDMRRALEDACAARD